MWIKRDDKKGLSPVIAVVLLLLITIISAGIIVSIVIPFIRNSLEGGEACFNILGDLSFDDTPYNCFYSTGEDGRTGFSVRVDNGDISGFVVSLISQGSSTTFIVEGGETENSLRMLLGEFNDDLSSLQVPGNREVRTYVAKGAYDKVELFPILKTGAKCELSDTLILVECEDQDAINFVSSP